MKISALLCLLVACGGALAEPAAPQGHACWAASVATRTSSEGLPIGHASHRPLLAVLDTLESMVRPNPGLLALPEVRLRIGREVNAAVDPQRMPRAAVLHALGFGPKAWGRGPCELIAQADRLGPRAGISFFVNTPTATLNRFAHDERLTTYLAKPATAPFQGWPTYGECAIVSSGRRLPWVAVGTGEMLELFRRQKQRELAEWDRRHADAFEPFVLAAAELQAEGLRAQNAAAADALLLGARQRKALEVQAHEALRAQRRQLAAEIDEITSTLAAQTPAQREAPYRGGASWSRLPVPGADDPSRPVVVKLDPGFPWDAHDRGRIQLITVCAPQIERNAAYHVPMKAAIAALDFARLASLLD